METIFNQRRNKLMETLANKDVHRVLILNPANIFYYTGFNSEPHERFMGLYLDSEQQTTHFFVPALDQTAAANATDIESIIPIADDQNPYEILKNAIPNIESALGIEGNVLQYNQSLQLESKYSGIKLVDIQPETEKQRLNKSSDEINKIQTAIDLIEEVLAEGIKKVQPGMTEMELTAELEFLMKKLGADGPSFDTIALAGENAALPHGVPGKTKIKNGDMLLIDFGVVKDGYCSDITRTFAVGDVPQLHKDLYEIVLAANKAGIEAIKAGEPLKNFDIAARNVINESGYGDYYHNRVGHGMGIEVHEAPSVHGANEDLATPGMVFTIEPGIYIPGETGIRIEDDVYINQEGTCEVLTSFPKNLQVL